MCYLDRVKGTIEWAGLEDVVFPPGERRAFVPTEASGQERRIPFHRVREVWRAGQMIWKRPD